VDAADDSYSAQRALVDEGLVALLARLLAPASPPAVRVAAARCVATVAGAARAVRAASASCRDARSSCRCTRWLLCTAMWAWGAEPCPSCCR